MDPPRKVIYKGGIIQDGMLYSHGILCRTYGEQTPKSIHDCLEGFFRSLIDDSLLLTLGASELKRCETLRPPQCIRQCEQQLFAASKVALTSALFS